MENIISRTSNINRYYNDVRKFQPLTLEQEQFLFEQYKKGDQSARDTIINSNLAFVVSRAKLWGHNGSDIEDLIQCGNLALLRAFDYFDPTTGFKFFSYAVRVIDTEIMNFVMSTRKSVRQTNCTRYGYKVRAIRNEFFQTEHREPIAEEIAEIMEQKYGITINDLRDLIPLSVDRFTTTDNDGECMDSLETGEIALATASTNEYEVEVNEESLSDDVSKRMRRLTEREKKIVCLVLGINCTPMDKEDIAEMLGMTYERVRQIYNASIEKMKRK